MHEVSGVQFDDMRRQPAASSWDWMTALSDAQAISGAEYTDKQAWLAASTALDRLKSRVHSAPIETTDDVQLKKRVLQAFKRFYERLQDARHESMVQRGAQAREMEILASQLEAIARSTDGDVEEWRRAMDMSTAFFRIPTEAAERQLFTPRVAAAVSTVKARRAAHIVRQSDERQRLIEEKARETQAKRELAAAKEDFVLRIEALASGDLAELNVSLEALRQALKLKSEFSTLPAGAPRHSAQLERIRVAIAAIREARAAAVEADYADLEAQMEAKEGLVRQVEALAAPASTAPIDERLERAMELDLAFRALGVRGQERHLELCFRINSATAFLKRQAEDAAAARLVQETPAPAAPVSDASLSPSLQGWSRLVSWASRLRGAGRPPQEVAQDVPNVPAETAVVDEPHRRPC